MTGYLCKGQGTLGKQKRSLGRLAGLASVALGPQNQQNLGRWKSQGQTQERTHVKELGEGGETKRKSGAHWRPQEEQRSLGMRGERIKI